jgi:hypothetical protein
MQFLMFRRDSIVSKVTILLLISKHHLGSLKLLNEEVLKTHRFRLLAQNEKPSIISEEFSIQGV